MKTANFIIPFVIVALPTPQFGWMPARLMTSAYFSVSDFMNDVSSSRVDGCGTKPSFSKLALTSGNSSALTIDALRNAVTSCGVPAGTMIELQFETSTPGKPASAKVGTFGSNGDRWGVVTTSGLSCPERISGSAVISHNT